MKHLLLIIYIVSLLSCTTTEITPPEVPSEIARISRRFERSVSLVVTSQLSSPGLGHQYLLCFPFTSIEIPEMSRFLFDEAALAYAGRGIRLKRSTYQNAAHILIIKEIQLSAFDFFFTRKIVARVLFELRSPGKVQLLKAKEVTFTKYAFEQQLRTTLQHAVRAAFTKIHL